MFPRTDPQPAAGGHSRSRGRGRRLVARLAVVVLAVALATPAWGATGVPGRPSIVAQALGASVAAYRAPGAGRPFVRLTNPTTAGEPLVFLVRRRIPGWDEVYLPIRPDETSGWIRAASVTLALDPYEVVVSLGSHRVTVYDNGRVIVRQPAGVGRSVLPTPRGTYYLVMLLKQPDPSGMYGPYAFGLSAYSNVLMSFGGGPGEIGLHGTDDPAGLGTNVSHGCIRVSNATITRLAAILPLGTPVVIVR